VPIDADEHDTRVLGGRGLGVRDTASAFEENVELIKSWERALTAELGGVAIAIKMLTGIHFQWWILPVGVVAWLGRHRTTETGEFDRSKTQT
jgi:hypothetical protein